jgi:Nucleotide-diphospho-sugar transferase
MSFNEQKTAFAILVFGELGNSAKISLQSIVQNSKSRICLTGDNAGLNWVIHHVGQSEKHRLCLHQIPARDLEVLEIDISQNHSYSHFGQERFIKLTTFKWYLLHSVLSEHKDLEVVIFSDLDVIWLGKPMRGLNDIKIRDVLALIQDDTPREATYTHFCTGIMFWFNNAKSILALSELYNEQFNQNKEGVLIPDEPIFNRWYESREHIGTISTLPVESFVIGHKFFKCMISDLQIFEGLTAFHANYVVGEKAKYRRLRTIELRNSGNYLWILLLFTEYIKLLYTKMLGKSN